jgi:hypothetical protein
VKIKTLYTCCEQVDRGGKDYETKSEVRVMTAWVKILRPFITTDKVIASGSGHTHTQENNTETHQTGHQINVTKPRTYILQGRNI